MAGANAWKTSSLFYFNFALVKTVNLNVSFGLICKCLYIFNPEDKWFLSLFYRKIEMSQIKNSHRKSSNVVRILKKVSVKNVISNLCVWLKKYIIFEQVIFFTPVYLYFTSQTQKEILTPQPRNSRVETVGNYSQHNYFIKYHTKRIFLILHGIFFYLNIYSTFSTFESFLRFWNYLIQIAW